MKENYEPSRVLMSPATGAFNPYATIIAEGLRGAGLTVVDFKLWRAVRWRADILHWHWPHNDAWRRSAFRSWSQSKLTLRVIDVQRRRGAALIWTAHNLRAHESSPLVDRHMDAFTQRIDGVSYLDAAHKQAFEAIYPNLRGLPWAVTPHPLYGTWYPQQPDRCSARLKLGLPPEARVVGLLGLLRDYKNLPELIDALCEGGKRSPLLLLAGERHESVPQELLEACLSKLKSAGCAFRYIGRALSPEELGAALAACDLIVFPYNETMNTGFGVLALEHKARVLARQSPAFSALQAEAGGAWVRTYNGKLTQKDIESAFASGGEDRLDVFLNRRSAINVAESLVDLYVRARKRGSNR
jgi:beta-1,4-mannosyltransferase